MAMRALIRNSTGRAQPCPHLHTNVQDCVGSASFAAEIPLFAPCCASLLLGGFFAGLARGTVLRTCLFVCFL